VRFGFTELGLDRIVSIYEPENAASGRVMDHLGFTLSRVAVHPGNGLDLHVRELRAGRWKQLVESGEWPTSGK
jgi:RimJ/RimL family protein N-acetyltransferase